MAGAATARSTGASPPRALVIGAGVSSALMHLPVLARLRDRGEVVLERVCDLQPERAEAARRQFGFRHACGDAIAALARRDIDIVYIFASAQLHHRYGLEALANGKSLFVEKPMAPGYAEAAELARAAERRGLIAVGGHNRRFYPSLIAARARAGRAGWRFAEAVFHKPEAGRPPPFGARTWLGANGVHALDALVFLMGGLPDQLLSLAEPCGRAEPAAFSALMRWPGGAQGVFLCDNAAGARREIYTLHAPGETLTAVETGLTVERDGASAIEGVGAMGDSIAAEHAAFLAAVRTGATPIHALCALAPSLHLVDLIEAGFSGAVRLPEAAVCAEAPARPAEHVLVAGAGPLQAALSGLPYRLITAGDLESADLDSGGAPRPEAAAAILGRGAGPLPDAVLAHTPGLKVVGVMGLSVARHAPEALQARGVALVNASEAYAESVAEFALGLAILGRRRAFASHEALRRGGWGTTPPPPAPARLARRLAEALRPLAQRVGLESAGLGAWRKARPAIEGPAVAAVGRDLKGATVGLIGWGANARAFAGRLHGAGARVLAWSERAAPAEIAAAGVRPAALAEVLAAEVVSLHRGLTAETRHGLGAAELARLRPGAVLINVARGALIEPEALLLRLKRGDVFACLDTFEDEPLAPSHPLRRLPNVFLTAHIAGGSPDMHAAAAEEVVRKVAAHLAGGDDGAIPPERLQAMT